MVGSAARDAVADAFRFASAEAFTVVVASSSPSLVQASTKRGTPGLLPIVTYGTRNTVKYEFALVHISPHESPHSRLPTLTRLSSIGNEVRWPSFS
jgi:hypothetical protein